MPIKLSEIIECDDSRDQCPACGRFVSDGWNGNGYADRSGHVQGCESEGEDERYLEDDFDVTVFCARDCADKFHGRIPPQATDNNGAT